MKLLSSSIFPNSGIPLADAISLSLRQRQLALGLVIHMFYPSLQEKPLSSLYRAFKDAVFLRTKSTFPPHQAYRIMYVRRKIWFITRHRVCVAQISFLSSCDVKILWDHGELSVTACFVSSQNRCFFQTLGHELFNYWSILRCFNLVSSSLHFQLQQALM